MLFSACFFPLSYLLLVNRFIQTQLDIESLMIPYRYYLQLMTEASCVEWAVVIAVVLRDALAVLRTTNAARGNEVSLDAVRRLRRTLQDICSWTDAEWYV